MSAVSGHIDLLVSRMGGQLSESPRILQLKVFLPIAALCILFWVLVKSMGGMQDFLATAALLMLITAASVLIVMRRVPEALAVIAYAAVLEPFFKKHAVLLPYLTLQYMTVVWALLLFAAAERLPKFRWPLLFYGAYVLVEIIGLGGTDDLAYGRAVLLPSIALLLFIGIGTQVELSLDQMRHAVTGFLLGGISLGAIIIASILSGEFLEIRFHTESNIEMSGGLGPVQVSFVLAVATFLSLWLSGHCDGVQKWFFRALGLALAIVMVMTFSRGGLYLLAGASAVFLLVSGRLTWKTVLALCAALGVGLYIFQLGAEITGGALVARYQDLTSSNRLELVKYGWEIFREHPFVGVGTGDYYTEVATYFDRESGAHNEIIRAAAEHGMAGFVLWLLFAFTGAWLAYRTRRKEVSAIRLALFALFLASTFHNGLKLLIQPLIVMLAFSFVGAYWHQARIRILSEKPTLLE